MAKAKPLSLHPLKFEEALKIMVSVPPPKKRVTKKQSKSKPSSKSAS